MNTSYLNQELTKEYNMQAITTPLSQTVTYLGTELQCYKLAYQFNNKQSYIKYCDDNKSWAITIVDWFQLDYARGITK